MLLEGGKKWIACLLLMVIGGLMIMLAPAYDMPGTLMEKMMEWGFYIIIGAGMAMGIFNLADKAYNGKKGGKINESG